MQVSSLSISIPAYNDEATIEEVIKEAESVASSITNDYEIFLVNDGSLDSTGSIIDRMADSNENIRVIHHGINKGFGETLKKIFTEPKREYIYFAPGDGQVKVREIYKLLPFMNRLDFVLGYRKNRRDPFIRLANSYIYNLLISLFLFKRVRDVNSVVLFKRKIIEDMVLESNSAFIHAELFIKIVKKGLRWGEVVIDHYPRIAENPGGGGNFKVIFRTILDLFHISKRLKDFNNKDGHEIIQNSESKILTRNHY
ncbi:MAG: glycosyltransferase family 2 protein [bacterium]